MAGNVSTRVRVLCLDGGGIRGLSEILILKELMLQVQLHNGLDFTPEPWQCFDFMCGTSTGGLVAVLLGRLGKTLDECEALFREFGSKIFSGSSGMRAARLAFKGSKHASEGLRSIREMPKATARCYSFINIIMIIRSYFHRFYLQTAVIAVSKITGQSELFRTYGVRARRDRYSIVDACLATSAATTFFDPITIDGVEFVDGAFGNNNPSAAALDELESVEWLQSMTDAVKEVGCFVSIGTGLPTFDHERSAVRSKFIPKGLTSVKDTADLCISIATDCYKEHLKVNNRYARRSEVYHRFDVERGLESVDLNESNEKSLQHISSVTRAHLRNHADELKLCAALLNPRSTTQIGELSGP
ncbi:acyl transferase/acyl hydrolase/lysophospholipase [Xylogone sp. PMI_703]|nr:acyl transferase/acyl hydrolase/lysophospholipase [Xylogone sp. PMI_703]